LFIFLEAFSDLFVAAVEAASQSSPGTRVKLHKVVAAEESLLLGESVEYAASKTHRPILVPMTHPLIPPPTTRAMLRFPRKIIFLEINRVNNITTWKRRRCTDPRLLDRSPASPLTSEYNTIRERKKLGEIIPLQCCRFRIAGAARKTKP
jgi:hypothetical protein